ncbi:MAG: metallophosphoesterase [Candidatus Odinarchaeota archaeon]
MWKDIEKVRKEISPEIDIILFSGDLVKIGDKKEDFEKVKNVFINPLLSKTDVDNNHIFYAPGNHDIQKSKVVEFIENGLINTLVDRDKVNYFLDDLENPTNKCCIERLNNFNEFKRSLESEFQITSNNLYSTHIVQKESFKIGIATLNSSWRATGIGNRHDYGKLLVGERQVDQALKDINSCDIKIAMFHHPYEWLNPDFDAIDVSRRLFSEFDLLFLGHMHDSDLEIVENLSNKLIISHCGCLYQHRTYYNGYSIINYDTSTNKVELNLRTYFDNRRAFDKAVNKVEDGKRVFQLNKTSDEGNGTKNNKLTLAIANTLSPAIIEYSNQMLFSFTKDSIAPKDLKEIFVAPPLKANAEYKHLAQETGKELDMNIPDRKKKIKILIEEVIRSNENFIIIGKKESGKTTLLNYICRSTLELEDTNIMRIPFYIDCSKLPHGKDVDVIEKAIKKFINEIDYNLSAPDDLKTLLRQGKALILFDDFIFDNKKMFKRIKAFITEYPKNRFIFTAAEDMHFTLDVDSLTHKTKEENLGVECRKVFIHSYSRNNTRKLIEKWFYDTPANIEDILDKIMQNTSKINVPRTPGVISLLLWIFEKQENYVPINRASLVEKVIGFLLEKANIDESRYRSFDYKDKEHYLSYIAYGMVEKNEYYFTRNDIERKTIYYFDQVRTLPEPMPVSKFIDYFIEKGIFIEIDNIITFKFKSYCEYFIARRMINDEDFYNKIISNDNYLSFINEIDYLTGLQRNNKNLLKLLIKRLEEAFRELNLAVSPKDFEKIRITKSVLKDRDTPEVINSLRKAEKKEEERDEILEDLYPEMPEDAQSIKRKQYLKPQNIFVTNLTLTSRVVRNCDQLEDSELTKNVLETCVNYWSTLMTFFMYLIQKKIDEGDELNEEISDEAIYFFKIVTPIIFQFIIHENLGSEKLERYLELETENKQDELVNRLLFTFLYSDLKLPNYLKKIKDFVKRARKNKYVLEVIFFKLFMYFLLRKLDSSERREIENLIAELQLKITGTGKRKKGLVISRLRKKASKKGKLEYDEL